MIIMIIRMIIFDDYEENRIETRKKINESKILNDKLIEGKEEIIKELDNKEKLINENN